MTDRSFRSPASPYPTASSWTGLRSLAWVIGLLALVAAVAGAWMVWAPENATLTMFIPFVVDETWFATELVDFWAPLFLIGGGILAALVFGVSAVAGARRSLRIGPAIELVMAMVGLAAIVLGLTAAV